MTALVKYEAARAALAEAHRIDEVKDIRDKAEAMAHYARQAKDEQLLHYATEIKVRAERRCGEMLRDAAAHGERAKPTDNLKRGPVLASCEHGPTVAEIGITQDQSHRYQRLAKMPEPHFEAALAAADGPVTTAYMLRQAKAPEVPTKPARYQGRPMKGKRADELRARLDESQAQGRSLLGMYVRLTIKQIGEQRDFDDEELALLAELEKTIQATRRAFA